MNKESIENCLRQAFANADRTDDKAPISFADMEIHYYDITDSTNIRAWEYNGQSTGDGALFVADTQSQGKGRRGRSWEGTAGCNLCFTLLLRPYLASGQVSMLTLVMALSVAQALEKVTGKRPGIKWPNDILLQGRKVCGILTELKLQSSTIERLIIGVGINVKSQQFPEELQHKAGALEPLCDLKISRSRLLAQILDRFHENYCSFLQAGNLSPLREAYESRLLNRHCPVRVLEPQGEYEGQALGITDGGELLVRRPDGRMEQVYAGEVSLRGTEGYF